jgi:hypothetical protein
LKSIGLRERRREKYKFKNSIIKRNKREGKGRENHAVLSDTAKKNTVSVRVRTEGMSLLNSVQELFLF